MNILYDERLDGVLPVVDKQQLLHDLQQQLPDLDILHRAEELRPYECDGLSAYRTTPLLVVLPRHIEEVQTLLRMCHERRVPVVARGAGTGLSGGALPLEQGVLLVMARFNRILEINPAARLARVQPAFAIWPFPRPQHPTACITRRTLLRRLPAPSAATWLKTQAAFIASNTG